jgi:hypothetical protein
VIRVVVLFVSLAGACAAQAVLTRRSLGPAAGFAPAAGHAAALHRGASVNAALRAGHALAVDLNVDAGSPFAPAVTTRGRFAALATRVCPDSRRIDWYRGGLFAAAMAVPIVLSLAATLVVGKWDGQCLVPWLAVGLWWFRPNVALLDDGWVELALVGPLAGLYLAGLAYFHRRPGTVGWLALAGASLGGWAIAPVPWAVFFLPATVAWLFLAHRHSWLWHGWLMLAVVVGAAPDSGQWFELARHRQMVLAALPDWLPDALPVGLPRSTAWGAFGIQLALGATPWIVAGGGLLLCRLAPVAGMALILLTVGSRDAANRWACISSYWGAGRFHWAAQPSDLTWCVDVAKHLRPDARLLCEVAAGGNEPSAVAFVGHCPVMVARLDDGTAASRCLADGRLAGRPLAEWSDAELLNWLDRWNIGWVWSRSAATGERLRRCSRAQPLVAGAPGELFAIDRMPRYLLKGQARVSFTADDEIILTDVVPDDGEVVLSLRYQPGWQVNPSRISVEPETDPYDAQPMIRLKLSASASRVVLRRDGR